MATPVAHHDHASPSGAALNAVAFSATLHCLTGCAIGEVLGMVIGTALGFSEWGTVGLAVALAFLFGYGLTSLPLLRSGLALSAVVPIALASDTLSIATMEVVDNAIMLAVPGAMEAGLDNTLFWGALAVALVVAGAVAYPLNRWLITRGKGHAVIHETGVHGGPPTRIVAIVAAIAFVFGTIVLAGEALDSDDDGHEERAAQDAEPGTPAGGGHDEAPGAGMDQDAVRGLSAQAGGLRLELDDGAAPRGETERLEFRILDASGKPVKDFQVEHTKRLHLIVVRRDMVGFQHLHPTLAKDGTWSTPLTLPRAGTYRVFADFKRDDRSQTLAENLTVAGAAPSRPLPAPADVAHTADGYEVHMDGVRSQPGKSSELLFEVSRGGEPVAVEPYLGARGHLVALREGDLAYLHVHPFEGGHGEAGADHGEAGADHGAAGTDPGDHAEAPPAQPSPISFHTEFPSAARYRLFLQFKARGEVHTAEFTREAG
jgi:hypothetical protein